jgi:hypothetical protein
MMLIFIEHPEKLECLIDAFLVCNEWHVVII